LDLADGGTRARERSADGYPRTTPPVLKLAAFVDVIGLVSERWVVQVEGGVRLVRRVAAQVLVEAMDLVAVAGFEQIQDVMDEVVDLDDGIVTEPGHVDVAWYKVVGVRVHCSSAMAC
jgi:hypothetical protein